MNKLTPFRGVGSMFSILEDFFHNDGFISDSFRNQVSNYNIEKTSETTYRISINVAGFKKENIEIMLEGNVLYIQGQRTQNNKDKYIHQGFSDTFQNRFSLSHGAQVTNASMDNGILYIDIRDESTLRSKGTKIFIK